MIEAEGIGVVRKKASDANGDAWVLGKGYIHAVRTRYDILPILTWNHGAIKGDNG